MPFSEDPGPLRYDYLELRKEVLKELVSNAQQAEAKNHNQKEFEKKNRENEQLFAEAVSGALETERFFNILRELHVEEVQEVIAENEEKIQQDFQDRQKQIDVEIANFDSIKEKPDTGVIDKIDAQIDSINALYEIAATPLIAELNKWEQTEWKAIISKQAEVFVSKLPDPPGVAGASQTITDKWAESKKDIQEILSSGPSLHKLVQHNPHIKEAFEKAYAENMEGKESNPIETQKATAAAALASARTTYELRSNLAAAVEAMKLAQQLGLKGRNVRYAANYVSSIDCKRSVGDYVNNVIHATADLNAFMDLAQLTYARNSAVQSLESNKSTLQAAQEFHRDPPKLSVSIPATHQPYFKSVVDETLTIQHFGNAGKARLDFLAIDEFMKGDFLDPKFNMTATKLGAEYVTDPLMRTKVAEIISSINNNIPKEEISKMVSSLTEHIHSKKSHALDVKKIFSMLNTILGGKFLDPTLKFTANRLAAEYLKNPALREKTDDIIKDINTILKTDPKTPKYKELEAKIGDAAGKLKVSVVATDTQQISLNTDKTEQIQAKHGVNQENVDRNVLR